MLDKRLSALWFRFAFLFAAMLLLNFLPISVAASEISVSFSNTDFIVGNSSGDMNFTAFVTNTSNFASNATFKLKVIPPSGSSETPRDFVALRNDVYSAQFYGVLPARIGKYSLEFYVDDQPVAPASGTPSYLTVSYDAAIYLSTSDPRIDDERVEIYGQLKDKHGNSIFSKPVFTVSGATISGDSLSNGSFYVRLEKITFAGPKALKFYIDDVEMMTWDVASSPLTRVSVNPGRLYMDFPQQILADASYVDNNGRVQQIDRTALLVHLSGVPILASSVGSYISFEPTLNCEPGEETYDEVFISAEALRNSQLCFTTTGTLKVMLSTQSYRYQATVELEVGNVAQNDLIGAPAFKSYAGDNTLDLRFRTETGRQIMHYWAKLTLPDGSIREWQQSATSIERLPGISYTANGSGEVKLELTCLDRSLEQWTMVKTYPFALPSVHLSQNSFILGEEATLTLQIKDGNGQLVKNARVTIEGVGSLQSANGSEGEYLFKSTWNTTGYKRIEVVSADGQILADLNKMVQVKAPEVLVLQPESKALLAGVEQLLRVKVYDDDGKELTGAAARVTALVDMSEDTVNLTWDGSNYTARVTSWSSVTLQAVTMDGKRASAKLEIATQFPTVQSNLSALTSGYKQHLEVSFVHPSSEEPLSGTVTLRGINLDYVTRNAKSNGSEVKNGSTFSWDIYTRMTKASEDSFFILDFTYNGRNYNQVLSLPVENPIISTAPEVMRANADQKIDLKILSAEGKPLEGVSVRSSSATDEKVTNSSGEVSFTVRTTSSEDYSFFVTREDSLVSGSSVNTTFTVKVPIIRDTTPPQVKVIGLSGNCIEASENPYTLQLEFTDDFGLDSFFIGVTKYPLTGTKDTWSGPVNLALGENTITLTISDAAGNRPPAQTVTINYTPKTTEPQQPTQPTQPTQPVQPVEPGPSGSQPGGTAQNDGGVISLVIGSLMVKRGETTLDMPPVPPKIINGRTMLPFRYLCQTVMQGTVDYDAATRKITTSVNGHVIVMYVDNPLITVDGVEILLSQAPILDGNNTMVPIKAFETVVTSIQWDEATQSVTIVP